MTVYIRAVVQHPKHVRWQVYWCFSHNHSSIRSDGNCYTWNFKEADTCEEARHRGQAVELETDWTHFGERITSVAFPPQEQTV